MTGRDGIAANTKNTIMNTIMKEAAKMLVALVLGLIYMWFALSFAWSFDDMSTAEKAFGIVYGFMMIPMYEGLKALGRYLLR